MKFRIITALLMAALLLTGCSAMAIGNRLNAAEDALENGMDTMEDMLQSAVMPPQGSTQQTTEITREQAEAIALEKAGFTADQVTRLRTEYEIDDGIPRYEVQFNQGRWEYDYEINANTGDILSYDGDD